MHSKKILLHVDSFSFSVFCNSSVVFEAMLSIAESA